MIRRFFTLLIGILFLFIACPSGLNGFSDVGALYAKIRTAQISKIQYCNLNDIAALHGLKVVRGKTTCSLSGKGISFKFTQNKKYATFNSLSISILFPVAKGGSTYYISTLDYRNVIQPLISRAGIRSHSLKTICIDPGHGGKDQGARGRVYLEKNITLAVAKKLGAQLKKLGYRVVYTRYSDATLTLDNRCALNNKYKANLFISLHCNATKNKSIRGIETFCMTPTGAPSTYDSKPRYTRYPGNAYDRNNFRLCQDIHRTLIATLKPTDRGTKHARFAVLRGVTCPGVLLELGFLSNYTDEKLLGSSVYQDKLATQIAKGVVRYHQAIKKK